MKPPKPQNSPNYDLFFTICRAATAGAVFACFYILWEINRYDRVTFFEPNRYILGFEIWLTGVLFAWQIWEVFRYR